ncbi:uncharacterized protein LOC141632942 [Silene latifolia]|uniref:uncharacterized protein LOC141632942 n=1 Tax=Silene latifolia TaxID=37657 RepID=UPI003D78B2A1
MDCITSTWFSLKINGDTVGFFKGECGLRQGDPLSPFLFVMSMEILSRLLRCMHSKRQVSYHPKCGRLGLNHLIFADDLMLFVRGDVPSVKAATQTLDEFAQLSGLYANPDKTNIYMGGVSAGVQEAILEETKFVQGEFPFRYLGVPLNEGRLNKEMFADLLNNIQKALHHWANYRLSYAGKLSLINTVIFGLEQFWCSTLLIPKGVIKLVTKFCRQFLWGTEEGQRKLIMKSWSSCCKPHVEGGFNIKEVLAWNKCLLCQDILLAKTGGVDHARALLKSCVAGGKLQLSLIYEQLRDHDHRISWEKTVWNKVALPKHSVLVVLAMQHKLATMDNLNHRGLHIVNRCILCKADNESHQHLFFRCQFVASIWHRLLHWLKLRGRTECLKRELHWLAGRRNRRHWKAQWISSCLTALTYSISEERNSRIFRDVEYNEDYIVRRVQYLV